MNTLESLALHHIGQIRTAEVAFGDLTVLVGPQASGKSIFLQFLKLALDTGPIHVQLRKHGMDWARRVPAFLDVYLGHGMGGIWRDGKSRVILNGERVNLEDWITPHSRQAKQLAAQGLRGPVRVLRF